MSEKIRFLPGEIEAIERLQNWFDETKQKREDLRKRFLDLEKKLEAKYGTQ